mmetsp:Transcript_6852/g.25231  ORF Transcript_6852/g.25231 Transcript_6852/m.25231 type:complete len:291 (-) Transcript_6852:72-944(-)
MSVTFRTSVGTTSGLWFTSTKHARRPSLTRQFSIAERNARYGFTVSPPSLAFFDLGDAAAYNANDVGAGFSCAQYAIVDLAVVGTITPSFAPINLFAPSGSPSLNADAATMDESVRRSMLAKFSACRNPGRIGGGAANPPGDEIFPSLGPPSRSSIAWRPIRSAVTPSHFASETRTRITATGAVDEYAQLNSTAGSAHPSVADATNGSACASSMDSSPAVATHEPTTPIGSSRLDAPAAAFAHSSWTTPPERASIAPTADSVSERSNRTHRRSFRLGIGTVFIAFGSTPR